MTQSELKIINSIKPLVKKHNLVRHIAEAAGCTMQNVYYVLAGKYWSDPVVNAAIEAIAEAKAKEENKIKSLQQRVSQF